MMKKLALISNSIICTLLIFSAPLKAQEVWQCVGKGLGKDISQTVNALLTDTTNNILYAAGSFNIINDTVPCGGLAMWDESNWSTNIPYSGSGVPGQSCLALFDGKIYVGGITSVFFKDGTNYQEIGNFNASVTCLAVYKDKLYAGGDFTKVNGVTANKIACWDGIKWTGVGGGVSWLAPPVVWSLGVWNDKLYVGGAFDHAGGVPANSIAAWDGTAWNSLSSGTIYVNSGSHVGYVYSIGTYNNNLVIGGQFDSAGGVFARNIARWDGSNWYSFAQGMENYPYCFLEKDNNLYVGGTVFLNTPFESYGVIRWDGATWHYVNSGLGTVYSLALYDSRLYAGGAFYYADGKKGIARLVDITGIKEPNKENQSLSIYPNPVTDELTISGLRFSVGDVLAVTDIVGRTLIRSDFQQLTANDGKIDISCLRQGVYLLSIRTKEGWQVGKFIKRKE